MFFTSQKTPTLSKLFYAIACMTFVSTLQATTWSNNAEVTDPISGEICRVNKPMSSGNYIYQWPSKFDGVYWPHTSFQWIWYCQRSGYISFGNDFESLSQAEIQRIRNYLETNSPQFEMDNLAANLLHLESIYRLRDKDEDFWSWFYRVRANLYETLAGRSRNQAIPTLAKRVETPVPTFQYIQTLFVLGNYRFKNGEDKKAMALFARARSFEWIDEAGNVQVGSSYINRLIDVVVAKYKMPGDVRYHVNDITSVLCSEDRKH